jgi:transcriptional regulator with GAF, ATPase, and Fis domain
MIDPFDSLMEKAMRVAGYKDMTVLLQGETGTGKTWLARKMHEASPRFGRAWVEVDCAAIPTAIAESEFFGHERGAFTGAHQARSGRIRSADGGTLFLDEIGELDINVQAKLLKVLEDQCVTPMGSEKCHRIDIRIIAATNRDLKAMVARREFRLDLLERLSQVCLTAPPLRERPGAARRLAISFLNEWNAKYGEARFFEDEALAGIDVGAWPGNIRELKHAVESACAQSADQRIGLGHLPAIIPETIMSSARMVDPIAELIPGQGLLLKDFMRRLERCFFERALLISEGNAARAAALLGMKGHAFRKALRERHALSSHPMRHELSQDASMEG